MMAYINTPYGDQAIVSQLCQSLWFDKLQAKAILNSQTRDYWNRAIEAYSEFSYSPIHHAIMIGSEDLLNFLIDSGLNIDAHDKNGNTPLMLAAAEGKIKLSVSFTRVWSKS